MEFWTQYLSALARNLFVMMVLVCIVSDTFFGCLRAAKYRKWNSSLGIDGGIRKVAMLFSVAFLSLIDQLVGINLIGKLPENVLAVLSSIGIKHIGVAEFFCVLYILYEATSILKNMLLCGLPIPAGLKEKAAKWLDSMTDESNMVIADEVSVGAAAGSAVRAVARCAAVQDDVDEDSGVG